MILIDLQKAYDSVDRAKLLDILYKRARTTEDREIARVIMLLHRENEICVGNERVNVGYGIAQGSVLAPYLFNIYLEEALLSNSTFRCLIERRDLLAYADDIAVFTKNDSEIR